MNNNIRFCTTRGPMTGIPVILFASPFRNLHVRILSYS